MLLLVRHGQGAVSLGSVAKPFSEKHGANWQHDSACLPQAHLASPGIGSVVAARLLRCLWQAALLRKDSSTMEIFLPEAIAAPLRLTSHPALSKEIRSEPLLFAAHFSLVGSALELPKRHRGIAGRIAAALFFRNRGPNAANLLRCRACEHGQELKADEADFLRNAACRPIFDSHAVDRHLNAQAGMVDQFFAVPPAPTFRGQTGE